MSKKAILSKILDMTRLKLIFVFFLLSAVPLYPFETEIYPEKPKAGTGFLLLIRGSNLFSYEITCGRKKYAPYRRDSVMEIFLPIPIGAQDTLSILVKKQLAGITLSRKLIDLPVEKREIKTVYLRQKDEAMRQKEPAVEEQQSLFLSAVATQTLERRWEAPFIQPLDSPVTTPFALYRKGKLYSYYHKGIDIAAPRGTPVKSANSGSVVLSETGFNIYGSLIVIDHGQGILSSYLHLEKIFKKNGDTVEKGEIIGEVGSSGWATGPHLHMGLHIQGTSVDPIAWTEFTETLPASKSPEKSEPAH